MSFKLQRYEERPATIQEHRALRDEIKQLREALQLAEGVLSDMIARGLLRTDLNGFHGYYISAGVMPKIGAALSSPNHTKD